MRRPPASPSSNGYGWTDWWKISVTNRLLRLICTVVGGVLLAGFLVTGAHAAFGSANGWLFRIAIIAFAVLLLVCLFLDLRLVWRFPQFAERNQALLIVHLVMGWGLGLLLAWQYGVPLIRDLPLALSIPLGIILGLAGLAAAIPFTLGIAGPSRVSTLCAFGSVLLGVIFEGAEVLTRVEVWSLLFEVLSVETGWITWAWTILLGICFFYKRGEVFFDF